MSDDPVLWCGKCGVVATCTINPTASEPVTVCMLDGEDIVRVKGTDRDEVWNRARREVERRATQRIIDAEFEVVA